MRKVSVVVLASVVVSGSASAEGETNLVSIEARAEIGTTKISMPFEPRLDTRYVFERVTVLRRTKRAGVEGAFKPVKVKVSLEELEDGFPILRSDPALVWRKTAASTVVRSGSLSLALGAKIAHGDEFCIGVRVGGENVVRVARTFAGIRMIGGMRPAPEPDLELTAAPTPGEERTVNACRRALKRVTKS